MEAEVNLNVLLSAYACEPGKGSEPGVGWNWLLEIAGLGHNVWVLTRQNNRESIETSLASLPDYQITILTYDLPRWARWWKRGGRGVQLYYLLWQWGAYRLARRVGREVDFDLVHHLTFGVIRTPSLMWRLRKPFVLGPIGGGEKTPPAMLGSYPLRGRILDAVRSASNWVATKNPLVRKSLSASVLILCRTPETLEMVPARFRHKCRLHADVGIDPAWIVSPYRKPTKLRLVSVARLLYWKGIHLTLAAFASIRTQVPDAELLLVGHGREKKWLMQRAQQLGLGNEVQWQDWMTQEKLRGIYQQSSLMMFLTLHDSGGSVSLEALASGTPVVCLDINGPSVVVPEGCGAKISVLGKTEDEVVAEIARYIVGLASDQHSLQDLSESSLLAASKSTWNRLVLRAYSYPEILKVSEEADRRSQRSEGKFEVSGTSSI